MNVNLTPQLEDLVKKKVASGLYNSAGEVVREALRLMEAQTVCSPSGSNSCGKILATDLTAANRRHGTPKRLRGKAARGEPTG